MDPLGLQRGDAHQRKRPLIPIDLEEVDLAWPLIERLASDIYKARYAEHLEDVMRWSSRRKRSGRGSKRSTQVAAAAAEERALYTHLRLYGRFEDALDSSDGGHRGYGADRGRAIPPRVAKGSDSSGAAVERPPRLAPFQGPPQAIRRVLPPGP